MGLLQQRSESSSGDHEPQLAAEYLRAGTLSMKAGREDEARGCLLHAALISQALCDRDPDEPEHTSRLVTSLIALGTIDLSSGHQQDAEESLVRAVEAAEQLADGPESDRSADQILATALVFLAAARLASSQAQDVESLIIRAIPILERIADDDPNERVNQFILATGLVQLGTYYLSMDREEDAEGTLTRAVAALDRIVTDGADDSVVPQVGIDALHAVALTMLGVCLGNLERMQEAVSSLLRAVAVLDALDERKLKSGEAASPATPLAQVGNSAWPRVLASIWLGAAYMDLERTQEAQVSIGRAEDALLRLIDAPDSPSTQHALPSVDALVVMLADLLEVLAEFHESEGRVSDADDMLARAAYLRQRLATGNPKEPTQE